MSVPASVQWVGGVDGHVEEHQPVLQPGTEGLLHRRLEVTGRRHPDADMAERLRERFGWEAIVPTIGDRYDLDS